MTKGSAAGVSGTRRAPFRALAAWTMFDWASQPFYTLIITFLFAPYFANAVVGDAVRGQALWGYAAAAAGLVIALTSPLLGAYADESGRRKPWLALFSALVTLAMAGLWIATPNASGATIAVVLACAVIGTIAAEYATVLTNAMMPSLVPASALGRLSGIGWAVGYVGGLVSLLGMAGLVVTAPGSDKTLIGLDPVLALDAAAREGDRLVGPFSALWYVVFMLPFFLLVPDRAPPTASAPRNGSAWAELKETLIDLPQNRSMLYFLAARMLYTDGLSAIFAFGGIYGAAVFGWQALELGLFGIVLNIVGAIGGVVGGWLDDRAGARNVIVGALAVLLAAAAGILSVDAGHVLYGIEVAPKTAGSAPFSSPGEQVFLAFAILVGLVAAPVQASSRSLLARLAPEEKMTQYFGLFAFSGKVTAFVAPFSVALVTEATGSQRAGMAVIAVFILGGIALILPVRERR
ncbi:MAG: MFS transporter [Pseudomonadota bacterium]